MKLQACNLKNEFLDRYFSRIFLKIKWNKIKLIYTMKAWNKFHKQVLWLPCVYWSIIIEMGEVLLNRLYKPAPSPSSPPNEKFVATALRCSIKDVSKSIDIWESIHKIDRKWTVAPFGYFCSIIWVAFFHNTGKRFFLFLF